MIFVTVGAQMPFDRMVRTVDAWAASSGRRDVVAQIGPADYEPAHLQWTKFLEPPEFRDKMREAELIISHAGMGTIITALELLTPLMVMPRRAALRETRNDHQVATAERFASMGQVIAVRDEQELRQRLERLEPVPPRERLQAAASPSLINALQTFITNGAPLQ